MLAKRNNGKLKRIRGEKPRSLVEDEQMVDEIQISRRSMDTVSSDFTELSRGISFRDNCNVLDLTINKLQYSSIQFIGREREVAMLWSRLQHMTSVVHQDSNNRKRKELVLIKGYSGVGKSTLANQLEEKVCDLENGIFVRGKFDLSNRNRPYSGIAEAFGEVCRRLKDIQNGRDETSNGLNENNVSDALVAGLGNDFELLVGLIPDLADLTNPSARPQREILNESHDFEAGQERWKYSFRVLTQVLSSYFSPLVIVLDDLHWADLSSLEIIEYLISDTQNSSSLMIVGCYRSNEVDDGHILSEKISTLGQKEEKFDFNITEIELATFGVKDVNKIIMAMLSIDDEGATEALAEICLKRTLGNPHFLIEYMTMLEAEDFLSYNLGMLKWVWDAEAIEKETMSTDNVVDLLIRRMKKFPAEVQLFLQYAACLGASHSDSMIQLVWTNHSSNAFSQEKSMLDGLYVILQEGNFIERSGQHTYHWVHDKVQEAALSLGNASTRSFQFEIGTILYYGLGQGNLEDSLFDIVNLINKGDLEESIEFAELNLRAAKKARSISAFHSSASYASHGIKLLPNDKWVAHRELTLSLYTLGVEMELAAGKVQEMDVYSDAVLSRGDCSTLEKLPLYFAQSYKLCTMELKYQETIDFCLNVLKELGCKLLSSGTLLPIQAVASLMRTVRMAKKVQKERYQSLFLMSDLKHKSIMLFLNRLFYASYLSQNDFLLLLSVTRMVQMTLKYGISAVSGPAFASLGLVTVAALQDYDTASYFAEVGISIQKRTGSKYNEATTIHTANVALPWTKPLQSCLSPFLEGYNSGMQSGNTSYAMWALTMYQMFGPFQLGKPLMSIEEALFKTIAHMEELKQVDQGLLMRIQGQMVLNLMGKSAETIVLKGLLFDIDGWVLTTTNQEAMVNLAQLNLYICFGDFERAAELALSFGNKFAANFPGHFLCQQETFLRGLALCTMAHRTKKRKYKKPAMKILKTVEKWIKNGNPNVQHYYCLLKAEEAALNQKYKIAESFYKESIVLAARTGHLYHAALSNERYADFLLSDLSDEEEFDYHIEAATRFYADWGAVAKVEKLMDCN